MAQRKRGVIWGIVAITLLCMPVAALLFQQIRPTPDVAADAESFQQPPEFEFDARIVYPTDSPRTGPVIAAVPGMRDGRVPLRAADLNGELHTLGASPDCQAVVVVFLGPQCPISNSILPRIDELTADYSEHGVEVYGVISSPSVTLAEAREHSAEFGIEFPVLFDGSQRLRERLRATHTPHAFVLNSEDNRYHFVDPIYSGAFDDQFPAVTRRRQAPLRHYVRGVLEDILNQHPVHLKETLPVGCRMAEARIGRAHRDDRIGGGGGFGGGFGGGVRQPPPPRPTRTYSRDIAPIVHHNCMGCHRSGAVAPFPLESYADVTRHAAQIREVVQQGLMPPWKPKYGFGHFQGDRFLTLDDRRVIEEWIDGGMLKGDPADAPTSPEFPDGWQLGEPDLVIDIPEFHVPADGPDIYQYFVIPTDLPEDRLVTAIEYQAENPQLVHHASFRYDDAGFARNLDEWDPRPGYQQFGGWGFSTGGTLGGWAVGVMPQRLRDGYGRPMKARSDFVVQTHYHPNGRAATDAGRVGIYFAPKNAKRRIGELFVANLDLQIPPGETELIHRAEYTLPADTVVHGVLPHTHLLGRQVWAAAFLPDESVEPLIWIDDWDFNWQSSYQYAEPLSLPAGTKIVFDVFFDNSKDNPMNPHSPPRWVYWGEASTDEMAVCYFDVSTPDDADLDWLIRHNRAYIDAQLRAGQ